MQGDVPWIQRAAPLGKRLPLLPELGQEGFTLLIGSQKQLFSVRGSNVRLHASVHVSRVQELGSRFRVQGFPLGSWVVQGQPQGKTWWSKEAGN